METTQLFNYHAAWWVCTLVGCLVALTVGSRTREAGGHVLLFMVHTAFLLYFGGYFILACHDVVTSSPWATATVVWVNAVGMVLNVIGFALRVSRTIESQPDHE